MEIQIIYSILPIRKRRSSVEIPLLRFPEQICLNLRMDRTEIVDVRELFTVSSSSQRRALRKREKGD